MRKILFFVFLLFSCLLFANPVTNVRAMQEGNKIVLLYDLEEDIFVEKVLICIDGKNREIPINTLVGAINKDVKKGFNHRIEYDVLSDYKDGLSSDNITFSIQVIEFLGIHAVDLGLSVKWASCNVGANRPEEYGDYFAWGEIYTKENYHWETYKYGTYKIQTKYNTMMDCGRMDNKTKLEPKDDVATINWGGTWRMPTKAEFEELRKQCEWEWTSQNGIKGYKIIGPNGNFIFLPTAGYMLEKWIYGKDKNGNYWSSSLSLGDSKYAFFLSFTSNIVTLSSNSRYNGRSIRPVCQ